MSKSRHEKDVLVRFWRTDHAAGDEVLWPPSEWPTLVYAESGILRVILHDRWHLLPSHRALWVPPGLVYAKRASGPCQVRSLYFSPSLGLDIEPGPLDVGPLLHELILAACSEGPLRVGDDRQRAMAELLVTEVYQAPWEKVYLPLPKDPALRELATNFADFPIPLDEMAEAAGMARRTLERRFKTATRMSLGQYSTRVRAMHGMRALTEGKSIAEASVEAGYASASAFCQAFRKVYGVSPREYRERSGSHR